MVRRNQAARRGAQTGGRQRRIMDRGIGDVGQTEGVQGGQGACPVRRRAQAVRRVRAVQDATVRQAADRGQRGQAAADAAVAQHLVRCGVHGRVGVQFLPELQRGVLVFRRREFRLVQRRRVHRRRGTRGPAIVRRPAVSADRVRPVGPVRADESLSCGQRGQSQLRVRVANRVRSIIRPQTFFPAPSVPLPAQRTGWSGAYFWGRLRHFFQVKSSNS